MLHVCIIILIVVVCQSFSNIAKVYNIMHVNFTFRMQVFPLYNVCLIIKYKLATFQIQQSLIVIVFPINIIPTSEYRKYNTYCYQWIVTVTTYTQHLNSECQWVTGTTAWFQYHRPLWLQYCRPPFISTSHEQLASSRRR